MFGTIFYHKIIRKYVTAFGSLFSNTTIVRYNNNGTENERFIVPVTFSGKEKFMRILKGDPEQDRNIQIKLPVISFELTDMMYDSTRKLQSMNQNFQINSGGTVATQYMPVPYNFDFKVHIYTRTIEDGTQIIEQILPFFTPSYTLRVDVVPTMDITKDVQIVLNSVEYDNQSDGPAAEQETRTIIWTLSFTLKGNLFGPIDAGNGLIREAITNIYDWKSLGDKSIVLVLQNSGNGTFKENEIIFQGNTLEDANAKAFVKSWSNNRNRLEIQNAEGQFVTGQTVRGIDSGASHVIINYEIIPQKLLMTTVTPDPPTANLGDYFEYVVNTTYYG